MTRHRRSALIISLLLLFSYLFLVGGQICAKMAGRNLDTPDRMVLVFIFGTYAFFMLRGLLWIFLLRRLKLVVAYPLMSIGYILVLGVSFVLFREEPTPAKIIGAMLLITGVVLISAGENRLASQRGPRGTSSPDEGGRGTIPGAQNGTRQGTQQGTQQGDHPGAAP